MFSQKNIIFKVSSNFQSFGMDRAGLVVSKKRKKKEKEGEKREKEKGKKETKKSVFWDGRITVSPLAVQPVDCGFSDSLPFWCLLTLFVFPSPAGRGSTTWQTLIPTTGRGSENN